MKKKISIIRIAVAVILCMIMLIVPLSSINSNAAGTNSSFIYSEDYFSGDQAHAETLQSYYTSMGYGTLLSSRPSLVYAINTYLSQTKMLYMSTHGDPSGSKIVLGDGVYFQPSDVTSDVNADFVFLSACYSAKTNTSSGKNICSVIVTNGAEAVIGYADSVNVASSRYFEKTFYNKFIVSKTNVYTAYSYARSQFKAKYGDEDTVYTSVKMFGNGGYTYP